MKYVALYILVACVIVFILQSIFPITDSLVLVSSEVLIHSWTLITHMFLHGSFEHLFYNMFALGLFGLILEKVIGSKKFIILYFVSGLIAALGSIMFYSASLGASGAIFGILGCLTVLRPRMTVYVSYIPLPMIIAAAVWIGGDLIGMVAPDQVAHAAHLFGMFFGIAVGLYYRKQLGEKLFAKRSNLWENR